MNLEIEGKISLVVAFKQRCFTQSKLSLKFTKLLLFPHKTAYFSNNSDNAYENADCNWKFHITNLNPWSFWKTTSNRKRWSQSQCFCSQQIMKVEFHIAYSKVLLTACADQLLYNLSLLNYVRHVENKTQQ